MGWSDCGESLSLRGALKGTPWERRDDTIGLAGVVEGLSPTARKYFAAGGMSILIGDGRLNYSPEMAFETCYALKPIDRGTISVDYQLIVNPGYNADRGPVSVLSLRLHAEQ